MNETPTIRIRCDACVFGRERDDGGTDLFCDYERAHPVIVGTGLNWMPRVTARNATCKDATQDAARMPTKGGMQ